MKRISLFLVAVIIQATVFGQTGTFDKDYYLRKSKNQRDVAWVFAVGGTVLLIAGIATLSNDNSDQLGYGSNFDSGMGLMGCGLAASAISVPFFISSASQARKAASLSFNNQSVRFNSDRSITKFQPTLTLTIFLR